MSYSRPRQGLTGLHCRGVGLKNGWDEATARALLYMTDLRLRVRGNAEATAIVDRCLRLLAATEHAGAQELSGLEAELEALRGDLERRFGPAKPLTVN